MNSTLTTTHAQSFEIRLLTRSQLARFLNVGTKEIPAIAERFGLVCLERHFPETSVWRQILETVPETAEAAEWLRQPLQDIHWMARQTNCPASTIRNKIAKGKFSYPAGVQLGLQSDSCNFPRMRRWAPEIVRSVITGDPLPGLRHVARQPVNMAPPSCAVAASRPVATAQHLISQQDQNNILAEISGNNAQAPN